MSHHGVIEKTITVRLFFGIGMERGRHSPFLSSTCPIHRSIVNKMVNAGYATLLQRTNHPPDPIPTQQRAPIFRFGHRVALPQLPVFDHTFPFPSLLATKRPDAIHRTVDGRSRYER